MREFGVLELDPVQAIVTGCRELSYGTLLYTDSMNPPDGSLDGCPPVRTEDFWKVTERRNPNVGLSVRRLVIVFDPH